MFTGLIKEVGKIISAHAIKEGRELIISAPSLIKNIQIDDSVAINGACQTATKINGTSFNVQAVHTTLDKTSLGLLKNGDEVNLELALRLSDRLGGHLVQGHINEMGLVSNIKSIGNNYLLSIKVGTEHLKYITQEGSITIDGVSLTVAKLDRSKSEVTLSVIPHTWANTTLKNKKVGSVINIEVDILAKYVENLLFYKENHTKKSDLTEDWFRSRGF